VPPFRNTETFSCWTVKVPRDLRASLAAGGCQATNSLSSGSRDVAPTSRQSRHAPAHQYRGARGGRDTEMDEEEWPALGNLARIWIPCGLVPEDRTLAVAVGLQGCGRGDRGQRRRAWWDGTVSISSPFTSSLRSLVRRRGGKGKSVFAAPF